MKTIDLDLAQELQSVCKEKNITMYKSDKAWVKYADERYIEYNEPFVIQHAVVDEDYEYLAPAFLLCELLEWLPKSINGNTWNLTRGEQSGEYAIYYNKNNFILMFDNPANAACKLLIWLIKEGLI